MPILVLKDITKYFGSHQVLSGVSLSVEPGEVVAIIGRSGSGKSTLLRCINGLEKIDGGTIEFSGRPLDPSPKRLKMLRRQIGFVFQSYNLFPHLSVERNITLGLTVAKGMPHPAARELAHKVLRRSASRTRSDIVRRNCPGASSNASPSPGRSPWSRA